MKPPKKFIGRLKDEPTPLIDGSMATFIWKGKTAPQLKGDFTDWESGEPVRMERSGEAIWTYQLEFPDDAYIEYAYFNGEHRLPDPFNPRYTPNGLGDYNQYFYMPKASPTPLAKTKRGIPHGVVTPFRVSTWGLVAGDYRPVFLYQPPVDEPCPLIVVWDGRDYLRRGRLVQIIENLVHQRRMQPVALAMVENGGPARMPEYTCSEGTLAFLYHSVLPLANEKLNILETRTTPGKFGIMGASMGGLMAMYTALRLPHIFSYVLCQSGGFWKGEIDSIVLDFVERWETLPLKIWMEVGQYDFHKLLESNRYLQQRLQARGYSAFYREYPGGHNYSSWRDEVWRGLEYLFPPRSLDDSEGQSNQPVSIIMD